MNQNETTEVLFFPKREDLLSHIDRRAEENDLPADRWIKPGNFTAWRDPETRAQGIKFRSALFSKGIITIADLDGKFTGPCAVIIGKCTPQSRAVAVAKIREHQRENAAPNNDRG